MAEITLPVRIRIGSGEESQVGEVTGASLDEIRPQLAALFRQVADATENDMFFPGAEAQP
jgi:hypothetical protein